MQGLIAFWSHALATVMFASLLVWRLGAGVRQPGQRLLVAAFALTACWAWLAALAPREPLAVYAETARNLVWVGLLFSLSGRGDARQRGVHLVYAAVAAVLGLQLVADTYVLFGDGGAAAPTARLLRITAAAGALVLVHNLYGQAAPESRSNIRYAMLGLALIWVYDLNLYTMANLAPDRASSLLDWRGLCVASTGPLFALAARREDGWRIHLSRAATFQSLSLLAICGYFAVMAILATALRGQQWDWVGSILVGLLAFMTVGAMIILPSAHARSWAKTKVAKHLFEHRYDYRSEWLRFTQTLGRTGPEAPPLSQRVIQSFADIVDSPGGLLLTTGPADDIPGIAAWNWPGRVPAGSEIGGADHFWNDVEDSGRIVEFDALRHRWAHAKDAATRAPRWLLDDVHAWVGIPLIHLERLVGVVILAAPDYRRPLDWEDFDLLRTAGRQAASSLAEAHGQEALSNAQRFEEFNRRFAFILHDIKNVVSQLSLLSRNAERHAENPEFRADMVATLKGSVGKMNDLLARLSPHAAPKTQRRDAQPLWPLLSATVAAKRRHHDVRLLGDCLAWAVMDPPGLEQAVGHLVQNAMEASPEGAPVEVRVAPDGDTVRLTISDQGCGMDSDFVRNRLFQPFASTKAGGFGIGSFEARSLITAMGGRLSVESRPGEGTIFTIVLPAAEPAVALQRKIA